VDAAVSVDWLATAVCLCIDGDCSEKRADAKKPDGINQGWGTLLPA